ncbi:MAG TPA: hypothetical protein VF859_04055, partial [Burkholderiales bacterium]
MDTIGAFTLTPDGINCLVKENPARQKKGQPAGCPFLVQKIRGAQLTLKLSPHPHSPLTLG